MASSNVCAVAVLLLKHFKRPTRRIPSSLNPNAKPFIPRRIITTEDHIKWGKKAKESTSAGLSGVHFGHLKAHCKRPALAELDASSRSVAYSTGHTYPRFKKGIDVQLLKRSGDHRAHKLRTIRLIEGDCNANYKAIGNDAMRSGERMGVLSRDNYGGRRGLMCIEVALNKVLLFNSIWARRGRLVYQSKDAKGCYDRIVHIVLKLALMYVNIPEAAVDSMIATIQDMETHLRTAFGISEDSYGGEVANYVAGSAQQGAMQGNGAAPAGWTLVFRALVDALKEAGFGYAQWSIIKQRAISIICMAMVDDTDTLHNNPDLTVPTHQVIMEGERLLHTWEGLIKASGGALEPDKGYWWLLDVKRKNGKWKWATETDEPGQICYSNGTPSQRLSPHEFRKDDEALGVRLPPSGTMKPQLKYLKDKIAAYLDAIGTKKVDPEDGWYCLTSTIMKTIEYPLLATSFTKKELDDLMRPLLQLSLNKVQCNKYFPRKLVYGTLETRGLDLKDPFQLQLIFHLQAILRHGHRDSPSWDLLNENMELVQYHLGASVPFWSLPFSEWGFLAPDGWMKRTWEDLWDSSLSLKGPSFCDEAQRLQDVFLMEAFLEQNPEKEEALLLKDCRLFLGVTTLSQISTACGSRITTEAWTGRGFNAVHAPPGFRTHRPPAKAWKVWRKYLRALLNPTRPAGSLLLQQQLGV